MADHEYVRELITDAGLAGLATLMSDWLAIEEGDKPDGVPLEWSNDALLSQMMAAGNA